MEAKREENESRKKEEPLLRGLQFNFSGWNLGGKLIFISTVIAILSLLLPWIEGDGDTLGYKQGASLFLGLYIYPFFVLTMDKKMNTAAGYLFGGLAVLLPSYFLYYMADEMAASISEAAGIGIIIFILCGILLLIGIHKYERYHRHGIDEEEYERGKPCPDCDKSMEYEEKWDRWFCEECDEYK